MKNKNLFITLTVILLLAPSVALANAGIPMIFITFPAMLVALIPIIILEMVVIRFILNSEWRETAVASVVSNMVSTFLGIPLAWGVFLIFEIAIGIPAGYFNINPGRVLGVILFAAWLVPDEKNLGWMIPLASMVLLVGFFYISYWIEKSVAGRFLKNNTSDQIRRAFWRANIFSYSILELVAGGFLAYALISKGI